MRFTDLLAFFSTIPLERRRRLLACVAVVLLASMFGLWSTAAPASAEGESLIAGLGIPGLSLPGPLGGAADLAIRAALSEFGKSLGGQMPIVVSPKDAYPTEDLPGPQFSSAPLSPDIRAALRASTDGTVRLPPGDYAFPVDVFCMKAHAGSPAGHRYLVAPLKGSAADIFRALNARLPSFPIDHHAAQVLSWNIQAGLAYGAMQAPQRAIIDQVIPDFRSKLEGDVLENIMRGYNQLSSIPGMPSFSGALGRLGPAGQAVLALQELRREMMSPPPTFEDLARLLVPVMPAAEASLSTSTPWSRYSPRVLVRFVTSGNYATPGAYQVRVLAEPTAFAGDLPLISLGDGGANVPFTNVVNNPGATNIQPLTQAPRGNGGTVASNGSSGASNGSSPGASPQASPSPSPSPEASITSETLAAEPDNHTRTLVGVREKVRLTFSGDNASWSVSGGSGVIQTSGKTILYRASVTPATETITAVDTQNGKKATIVFNVIAPTGVFLEMVSTSEIHHWQNRPSIGFNAAVYMQPDSVSFDQIALREGEAFYVAWGVYWWMNGQSHNPDKDFRFVTQVVPGKGNLLGGEPDDVWSGDKKYAPIEPGFQTVDIPFEYMDPSGNPNQVYPCCHVTQTCRLEQDGNTLTAEKGNLKRTLRLWDPTQP